MAIKKIKEFNRPTLKTLRASLEPDLKKLGKKFGINLSIGNITFSDYKFTTRMTATTIVANKIQNDLKNSILEKIFKEEKINKKWLTKSFSIPGRRGLWKVIDYKYNRPKYPWLVEEVGGNRRLKCKDIKSYLK
jgi:hypothetical protein